MTYEQLMQERQFLLLDCVSGSKAYNLDVPGSDTDHKGVFILPHASFFGFNDIPQISDASNDNVYFEIRRFIELLCKNNPNILELLSTDGNNVLFSHPLMELIKPEDFLSKLCMDTFAGYAKTQIKKAHGLNKKVNKPLSKERKTVTDFCYVQEGKSSIPLHDWLHQQGFKIEDCGLTRLPHFRDTYLLYHDESLSGIVSGAGANDVSLSPIPKELDPMAVMNFNKDGYSVYCREYKEYWNWVENRNEERHNLLMHHGKNYDTKHMMHTIRLLTMAEEIAVNGKVQVYRHDREFLLRVRNGEFELNDLLLLVEEKMAKIEKAYAASDLPDQPDPLKAERLLVEIRTSFYNY